MKQITYRVRRETYEEYSCEPKEEIMTWERFSDLPIGKQVLVMHNCSMDLATICHKESDMAMLNNGISIITVRESSFGYHNFMYI